VRLLPSIPGYIYAQNGNDVYVNLFISGTGNLMENNKSLKITQQNNYPWEGGLAFIIDPVSSMEMNLDVRIPGWAQDRAIPSDLYGYEHPGAQKIEISVNGKPVEYTMKNGYAVIGKKWKKNDKVELTLPMEVRRVVANTALRDDNGKVALQRGPIMYCAEWKDNDGKATNLIVPKDAVFTATYEPSMLNGVTVLKAQVKSVNIDEGTQNISTETKTMTAIPYCSWANRGKGEMTVWFPETVKYIEILTK
jgi:DUF1680 family protein